MNNYNVRSFVQGLLDKLNDLPTPSSLVLPTYLNFMIVEAVLFYKTTFQYCEILEIVDFLKKCFISKIPVGDKHGFGNDIRELSNKRFTDDLNELNKNVFAIRLRLMSSEIKSRTKQLGIKAKALNDSKLNVKNSVPNEIYNCWKEFVQSFETSVKQDMKMRVMAEYEKLKNELENAKKRYAVRSFTSAQLARPSSNNILTSSLITTPTPMLISSDGYSWVKPKEYFNSKLFLLRTAENWENDFDLDPEGNNRTKSVGIIQDAGSSAYTTGSSPLIAVHSKTNKGAVVSSSSLIAVSSKTNKSVMFSSNAGSSSSPSNVGSLSPSNVGSSSSNAQMEALREVSKMKCSFIEDDSGVYDDSGVFDGSGVLNDSNTGLFANSNDYEANAKAKAKEKRKRGDKMKKMMTDEKKKKMKINHTNNPIDHPIEQTINLNDLTEIWSSESEADYNDPNSNDDEIGTVDLNGFDELIKKYLK